MTRKADEPRITKRRIRLWHGILVLAIVLVATMVTLRWRWRREFRQRIEALAAAGYPVTLEQLDASYERPESGENAGEWILDACSYYSEPASKADEETVWSIVRGRQGERAEPLTDEARAVLTQHIAANAKTLEVLRRAATMEHSRYPIDLKKGYAERASRIGYVVNTATFLLAAELASHVETGDAAGAVASMQTCLGVANSLAPEPRGHSQLMRRACISLVVTALQRVMSRVEFTDEQLITLDGLLAEVYRPQNWVRAVSGDQCLTLALHRRPELLDEEVIGPDAPAPFILLGHEALGWLDRSGIASLDLMQQYIQTRRLPLHERLDAVEDISRAREAIPKRYFIVHQFMWSAHYATQYELGEIARVRTARVALAVERYRLAHGALPGALNDLPANTLDVTPTDPYDGAPLRYKRLDRGFVVYSIGKDDADNGGKERRPSRARDAEKVYDITFTVER